MNDHARLESAVPLGRRRGPKIHPHAAVLTIGGSAKVRIVGASPVLGVEDGEVISLTALAVVVDLKVPGGLVEAQEVQQVVILVSCVEQLRDRGIDVALRRGHVW